jgi:hypothetical protein
VSGSDPPSVVGLLTLREVRAYLRRSHAIAMTVFFGLVYALGSMLLGGMIVLAHLPPPYYSEIIWYAGPGQGAWNFPVFLLWAPWGTVTLPFFATWATVAVSIGVAIGMSVAVLLSVQLVRQRLRRTGAPTAVGSIAGLTPAMLALVTLGACCGTTAAATAGVGTFAQITGTSTNALLDNDWLLGAFQIVVVWLALLAQEMLLQVYGGVIGVRASDASAPRDEVRPAPIARGVVLAAVLRFGLLVAGVTWALALLVGWAVTPAASASSVQWAAWLLEYGVVAVTAIVAAMFPRELAQWFAVTGRGGARAAFRGVLLIGGLTLAVGAPPPLAGRGLEGFGNELLGVLGAPAAWGAVSPVFAPGIALYLRWGFQYLLLGGFSIAVALRPIRVTDALRRTAGRFGGDGTGAPFRGATGSVTRAGEPSPATPAAQLP